MKVKDILQDNSEWIQGENYAEQKPIVSVLLPTFRRARDGYFERAVQSVLNQTFKDLELIIIDDASTDGTKDLIEYFMKIDPRVQCIRHKQNVGLPAISEYEGYMKARGEYIAFIFDDNEWDKDYIAKTIPFMIREKVKASFGIVKLYYGEKENEYIALGEEKNKYEMNNIYRTNFIGNAGVVLHKEVIENVGLYDPHVSIKRVCDWDLWRRVCQKYDFEFTNVDAGSEHGFKLNDSLGNTENLDSWVSLEQMSKNRDNLLLPDKFLDYDIFEINENNTDLFIDTLKNEVEKYTKKNWFDENMEFYNKFLEIKKKEERNVKKRFVVVCDVLDATTNVSFFRYSQSSNSIIFRFENTFSLIKDTVIYTDAFIFMRKIKDYQNIIEICKKLEIPCYYYIDDNFIVLNKDIEKLEVNVSKEEQQQIKRFSKETENLKFYKFRKVFCSTEMLKRFFIENEIHSDVEVLNPIIDFDNIFKHDSTDKNISIAFMGGNFRNKILKEVILPAIVRLSEEIPITFCYPKNKDMDIKKIYGENEKIKFIEIEKSLSLSRILRKFGKNNIDILVHCGEEIENNQYKTENSLLNAVQLGAVLLTSNTEPYKTIFNSKEEYIRVENSIENWYLKLKEISFNKEMRIDLYKKAYNYCKLNYSGEKEKETLDNVAKNVKESRYIDLIKRYKSFYMNNQHLSIDSSGSSLLHNRKLNFSGLIENKRSYNIKCNIDKINRLGLLFASYGEPKGHIIIRILEKNNILREVSYEMENFVKDNWSYIDFNTINNSLDKVFTIELEFFYEKGSVLMGVFENTENRTFKYKLLNKLKYPAKGLDVLCVDCK